MRARIKRGLATATALAATTAVVAGLGSSSSAAATPGLRAFGITSDGTLMATFTTDKPQVLDWVAVVTGLQGDQRLIGIDFRVQNNTMYGVGDAGGVYTITTPTPPVTEDVVVKKVSQLTVQLYGTNFGVDFNPAADRLRVISDNGQNLSHNLNDGTTTEQTVLTTPPATGPTKGVTAAAYTNNDLNGDTGTTLFDINTITDQVVIQSPPNLGFLVPTGALGLDAGPNAGFDISAGLTNGKTTSNSAFATLVPPGSSTSSLYSVDLLTGAAMPVGRFPLAITDIAIALGS
jgi:hypothetical protein